MNIKTNLRRMAGLILFAIALAAALQSSGFCGQAAFDWALARELYPGIMNASLTINSPRPMKINALRIDARTPTLRFFTTPRQAPWVENETETLRQTTRDFIRTSQATDKKIVIAVNADAFSPWPAPWDKETPTNLRGLAVSEGVKVSGGSGTASLIIKKDGTVSMAQTTDDTNIAGMCTAVSGFAFCLTDGNPMPDVEVTHPRTGVGLSRDSRYVYFITIDGRRHSSHGATTTEVGVWLKHFGAFTGINMDGGGSTTMAWWNPQSSNIDKCELLNSPVGDGTNQLSTPAETAPLPLAATERRNGNNIGVYYLGR